MTLGWKAKMAGSVTVNVRSPGGVALDPKIAVFEPVVGERIAQVVQLAVIVSAGELAKTVNIPGEVFATGSMYDKAAA
jgi:hypothetical protein